MRDTRIRSAVDAILARLAGRGHEMYGGEAVTQLQHALQCATFARGEQAPQCLATAALLHDYGHLLTEDEGAAEGGVDMLHEEVAAAYLSRWFGPAVTEPIRMHVDAKRYLCAVEPDYFANLSLASLASLRVQGGPLTEDGAQRFMARPYAAEAVRLRIWDDKAKDPAMRAPPLEDFREDLEAAMLEGVA